MATERPEPRLTFRHVKGHVELEPWEVVDDPAGVIIGCDRNDTYNDIVLTRDNPVISAEAAVVFGPSGLWQLQVLNDAGVTVRLANGRSWLADRGDRVAINPATQFRFAGDEDDTDEAAIVLIAEITDPLPLREHGPTTTRTSLRLSGTSVGLLDKLKDHQWLTLVALCARLIVMPPDLRQYAAPNLEISQMLHSVPDAPGASEDGRVVGVDAVYDRLSKIRKLLYNESDSQVELKEAKNLGTVNEQLARWVIDREGFGKSEEETSMARKMLGML